MKTIKFIKSLTKDEREVLMAAATFVVLFVGMIVLLLPSQGHPDYSLPKEEVKKTYELRPSFNKYMNHVYNDKFNK